MIRLTSRPSRAWLRLLVFFGLAAIAYPQATDPAPPAETAESNNEAEVSKPKRIFALLPNYRTTSASQLFSPLSAREKLKLAQRDALDYPAYFMTGVWAGLYQMQDRNPSFGQGAAGYAKRYGAAWGDQTISNVLSEGVFPATFRQDPRYFRLGPEGGGAWRRTRYAMTRIFVTRNDSGRRGFNYSEWAGVGVGVAASNLYYPSDTRDVSSNLEKLCMQVGGDAFYNFLREFWPDWYAKLSRKK